jgi:hypothetical protein
LREKETWKPPPDDVYKINVDASFQAETKKWGWGFIVRNKPGNFLKGGIGNLSRVACPLQTEALAVIFQSTAGCPSWHDQDYFGNGCLSFESFT